MTPATTAVIGALILASFTFSAFRTYDLFVFLRRAWRSKPERYARYQLKQEGKKMKKDAR
jgi:hypothetical protein